MGEFEQIAYFVHPEVLWLLLLIPAYILWYLRYYAPRRLLIRLSYDPLSFRPPKINLAFLRFVPRVLQLLALAMMIIAMARPQFAREIVSHQSEGIDIMLLLDTSGSMETDDFPPNRLEVAKNVAISFINGLKQDRVGIVLFAEEALSYSPLTLDHQFLKRLISSIHSDILPKQGTAIGSAIAIGINRLRESPSPSRVMILITDGANNRGQIDPITAARLARLYGIRIYCIGIGREVYLKQFPLGGSRQVKSDLDEQTLIEVASITGGAFFRSTDAQSLQAIFEEIAVMETSVSPQAESVFREPTDRYPFFVKAAIILLGLSFVSMLTFMYNPLEQ